MRFGGMKALWHWDMAKLKIHAAANTCKHFVQRQFWVLEQLMSSFDHGAVLWRLAETRRCCAKKVRILSLVAEKCLCLLINQCIYILYDRERERSLYIIIYTYQHVAMVYSAASILWDQKQQADCCNQSLWQTGLSESSWHRCIF